MASTRWFLSTAIVCASFAAVWSSSAAATVSSRADGSQDFVLDVDDTTVTVGRVHACVIKATVNVAVGGRVVCWGDNSVGQTDAPKDVIATQVSASADYTCAVTVRDTVVCWGALPSRTIGYQTWTGVAQVSAGVVAICAVTRDGALRCTGDSSVVEEAPEGRFSQVSCGKTICCATTQVGALRCWGFGMPALRRPPAGRFVQVSVGTAGSACAVASDGSLSCWGVLAAGGVYVRPGSFVQVSVGHDVVLAVKADGALDMFGDSSRMWAARRPLDDARPVIEVSNYIDNVCVIAAHNETFAEVACWDDTHRIDAPPLLQPALR